jgi:hypothetical protein
MASSFSTDLKLELMVTGENSGTWGDKTNTNLNLLQQAIAGYQSIALTSINTTLVMTDATISDARNAVIEFTGTLAANATVFVASGIEKTYTIKNSTTGAFTLALNQVGGSSVIWGATEKNIKGVYLNGTNANTIDLSTLGGQISTSTALADFVIGPNELDTASVTEVKIASSAVTSTKIASFAVTSGALDTASVTSVKIAAAAVGPTQLANTSVTAGSFTVASITVDAQGRITAASSGTAGGGAFEPKLVSIGPSSGTFTKSPGANRLGVYLVGAGGGGTVGNSQGGGYGGFGYYSYPAPGPFSQPYSVGAPGNAPGSQYATGNTGGNTTLTNVGTANGGAGAKGPGQPPAAAPGNAPGATLVLVDANTGSGQGFLFGGFDGNFAYSPDYGQRNIGSGGAGSNGGPGGLGAIVVYENTGT